MSGDGGLIVLVYGPALLGVAALLGIIALSQRVRRREPGHRVGLYVGIAFLSVVALGIGTCYGMLFLAGSH